MLCDDLPIGQPHLGRSIVTTTHETQVSSIRSCPTFRAEIVTYSGL